MNNTTRNNLQLVYLLETKNLKKKKEKKVC